MKIDFGGRRALVTGAGKGIGREIARLLSECSAQVVALSRAAADIFVQLDKDGGAVLSGLLNVLTQSGGLRCRRAVARWTPTAS